MTAVNCVVRPSALTVSVLLPAIGASRQLVEARPSAPVFTVAGVALPEADGAKVTVTLGAAPFAVLTTTVTETSDPATTSTKLAGIPAAGATLVVAGTPTGASSAHATSETARTAAESVERKRTGGSLTVWTTHRMPSLSGATRMAAR